MSLRYNWYLNDDGSYSFISDQADHYLIYFFEQPLDPDGSSYSVYSIGFSKNGEHDHTPFSAKYDPKVSITIISAVNDFFLKNEHRTLMYFCYNEDGYARHRNIIFSSWVNRITPNIEKQTAIIKYGNEDLYISLLTLHDNPLKETILQLFQSYINDLTTK